MVLLRSVLAAALLSASASADGVVGSAFGFASGTTGGGSAAAAAPADIKELKEWLTDSTPRVILIDKEFNFIGSEDTCTDCECCIPDSNTCGSKGQNAIKTDGSDWCGSYPTTKCTYDNAGIEGINVASDKSIVGVGSAGVIRGKGLRLVNGVTNIIIQNVHFTELNPQYIWGGDAITLDGTDKVWIDHVKVSKVGRQMIATGYKSSGGVTISNSEFDGQTSWSASCDGHHYWTVLGYGKGDKVTFANNYLHHTSGRSPKLEFNSHWHAYNNYWENNSGHAFDVGEGVNALIEGNVFSNVKTPMNPDSKPGLTFAASSNDTSSCTSALGRACVANKLTSSGTLSGSDESVLSSWPKGESGVKVMSIDNVPTYVKSNAGTGKIGNAGASGSASASVPAATSSATPSASASAHAKRHIGKRHH
ncbi:pectin lyase fold/virulence factor [Aspergillus avenaceus]|uniref:pectin lyase n=1 Tax=Aspergillus avenaceus TaxID=36643 RepID=A0A5N6TZ49_ASPAV|nr:pectin lyase fold/virulence factor [Aspergillus avenaceus]